jgi:hypothetical protein
MKKLQAHPPPLRDRPGPAWWIALALGFVERTADRTPITDLQVIGWWVPKVFTSSTSIAVRGRCWIGHRRDGRTIGDVDL